MQTVRPASEWTSNPTPGLYAHVDFEAYKTAPLMSNSKFKDGRESMAHLKAAMDGARTFEATDDMLLGSALHVAFLEPELVATRVAVWTGAVRRGKAWDEFKVENAGRYILTEAMYEKMQGMVRALRAHAFTREVIGSIQHTELSCVGELRGVPFKARADAIHPDMVIDVKKVRNGSAHSVTSSALEYGYHTQAYCYTTLFARERFVLLTVEDRKPFDVVPYELSPAFIRAGKYEANTVLDQLKFAQRTNQWPGRSPDLVQLEVPEWAVPSDQINAITVGGEAE